MDDNTIAEVIDYCILPVISQVTEVFLKIFGFSFIVSNVKKHLAASQLQFVIILQYSKVSISTVLQCEALTYSLDIVLGVLCSLLFYHSSTLYLGMAITFCSFI